MKTYIITYRPDLFWSYQVKSTTSDENYVVVNKDDAENLADFLANKKETTVIPKDIQNIIDKSKTEEYIMKKKNQKKLLWVVDVQNDFMLPNGKLYVQGAEKIIPNIVENIVKFKKLGAQIVCTMDYHKEDSAELSKNPDFINTFPEHCMMNTDGANLVDDIGMNIYPSNTETVDWFGFYNYQDLCEIAKEDKIIITKDKFDVFTGNPYTNKLVEIIKPDVVYVCGVATSICVNFAILGLLERGIEVHVLIDSIKDLPSFGNSKETIDNWVNKGAILN